MQKEEVERLFEQARQGTLPANFSDWELADENGWTVAHDAAWASSGPGM